MAVIQFLITIPPLHSVCACGVVFVFAPVCVHISVCPRSLWRRQSESPEHADPEIRVGMC